MTFLAPVVCQETERYIGYKFTLAVTLFYTEPKIFAVQKLQCVFVYLYIFRYVTTQNEMNLHSDTSWCTFARLSVCTDCVLCVIFDGICAARFNIRYSILPNTVYSCVCVCVCVCVSYDSDTTETLFPIATFTDHCSKWEHVVYPVRCKLKED